MHLSSEVESALAENKSIVALESTVIAHGLPRPQNLETAHRLEQIVRAEGATPATVAVIGGNLFVGLSEEQIEFLANGDGMKKISTRDVPVAVGRGWNGATTVAATIWIAHRAGIRVLATGGIGGVHRGSLPDVSADLPELARTPMIVVCSGAKIVLELPATREWLETYGVTVVGYGCDEMPAFYSRESGLLVDARGGANCASWLAMISRLLESTDKSAYSKTPDPNLRIACAKNFLRHRQPTRCWFHLRRQISKFLPGLRF